MRRDEARRIAIVCIVVFIAGTLMFTVSDQLLPFGSFPEREVGESIGQQILERAVIETGAANTVTSVIWDYRAYDTLGEATILFTAVVAIAALFRALGKDEDEEGEL